MTQTANKRTDRQEATIAAAALERGYNQIALRKILHVFNPDHNLVCEDCGEGELAGRHGIAGRRWEPAFDNWQGGYISEYESPEAAALYAAPGPNPSKLETVEVAADLFMALQREAKRACLLAGLLPDVAAYLKMVQQDNSVPSWLTFGAGELLARIEAAR